VLAEKMLVHLRKWGNPKESLCGEEGYKIGYPLQTEMKDEWTSDRYERCANCKKLDLEAKVEGSTYELRVKA